jgi:hypothetical protein
MTDNTTSVAELHFDHEVWTYELKFWREELKIFEKYLSKIDGKKLSREATSELEHFQNQFIHHKKVVHDLIHEASSNEKFLVNNVDIWGSDAVRKVKLEEHAGLDEQMDTARKIYTDLKRDFRNWLASRL